MHSLNAEQDPSAVISQINQQISVLMGDALEYARRGQVLRMLQLEAVSMARRHGGQGMVESMSPALREDICRSANQYQIMRLGERLERLAPEIDNTLGAIEWPSLQRVLDGRRELINHPLSKASEQSEFHFITLAAELERELPDIRQSLQLYGARSGSAEEAADKLIRQCDWVAGWMRRAPLSEPRQLAQMLPRDLSNAAQLSDALCAAKLQAASHLYSQASISLMAAGLGTRGLRKTGLDAETMQHVAQFSASRLRDPFKQYPALSKQFGDESALIAKLQNALKSRGVLPISSPLTQELLMQAGLPSPDTWLGREQVRHSDGQNMPPH